MLFQITDIGVAGEKPKKFMHDGFRMELFRRQKREAIGEIEPHLMAENGARADAGAVDARIARFQNTRQKVKILSHKRRESPVSCAA